MEVLMPPTYAPRAPDAITVIGLGQSDTSRSTLPCLSRLLPAHVFKKLFRPDVSHALFCAAAAGIVPIIRQIVTVIERKLLPGLNIAGRENPNPSCFQDGIAIRR